MMDPDIAWWWNASRFLSMLLGAVLIGLLYRWASIERRRCYSGFVLGLFLLTVENIVDHILRLDTQPTWRVPVNLLSYTILILSARAMTNRARRESLKRKEGTR